VFELIAARSGTGDEEMHNVFNMGCGFCVVVPAEQAGAAVDLLSAHHPGTAVIGEVTQPA
jgi:phosphoribosylaminoimidazole (AIR) synthetase